MKGLRLYPLNLIQLALTKGKVRRHFCAIPKVCIHILEWKLH